jgi:hypothetical protein
VAPKKKKKKKKEEKKEEEENPRTFVTKFVMGMGKH